MTVDDEFLLDDDDGERTAVVNLAELHGITSAKPDRHLLVRVQGTQLGKVHRLPYKSFIVGRSQESDLWVPDDGVSRRHARIGFEKNVFFIEDLNSANGTFVQGARITKTVLKDGDLIQLGPSAVFRYSITDVDQEALLQQLYSASVTDSLTGCANREHFETQLATELSYARRHRSEFSIVMFDLDHFKSVNDTYGHPAGDAVLVEVATTVRGQLRAEDLFARYGGEEFAILLRGIDVRGAQAMAERVRQAVEALQIEHGKHRLKVTLSLGCASIRELAEPKTDDLIGLADRRLYAAKHQGRNRVVASG